MEAHFTSTTHVVARIPPSVKTEGFLRDYSAREDFLCMKQSSGLPRPCAKGERLAKSM